MIEYKDRKALNIIKNGNSTDYLAPSIVIGCLLDCSYCYMKRNHPGKNLNIAKNLTQITYEINRHVYFIADDEKPNQTDDKYITYDIGCNSDLSLDMKFWDWKYVFQFFKDHEKAKASFATKYVNDKFLEFNPERKVRIRFSLMPQHMSYLMEANSTLIEDRIKAINKFYEAGYDVHINFSPIIYYPNWVEDYKLLFKQVDELVNDDIKHTVKCEVIFLTHNDKKHECNLTTHPEAEKILWQPNLQEKKISKSYGSENLRYNLEFKRNMIDTFKKIHDEIIPWNTIRYIF
jgi:spore photoproduct lyase